MPGKQGAQGPISCVKERNRSTVAVKIAVLTDLHYRPGGIGAHNRNAAHPEERGDMGHVLWLRAIHRLNRLIRPDVVCVLGDLLDDGAAPGAVDALRELRGLFDQLKSPWIALPGNHDPAPEVFWSVFERPADWMDIGGVRFLPFADPEEPGFCASRPAEHLERMAYARAGWRGPIVSLQHVPLFPPGTSDSPFHYTNVDSVIASMRRNRIELALSGHYHPGIRFCGTHAGICFATAPALCRPPFEMLIAEVEPGSTAGDADLISVARHALAMDPRLRLTDRHIHTQLAYCAENVDARINLEMAREFGLAAIGLSEHADHLYMNRLGYFSFEGISRGGDLVEIAPDAQQLLPSPDGRNFDFTRPQFKVLATGPDGIAPQGFGRFLERRIEQYLSIAREAGCESWQIGTEVSSDFTGRPMLAPRDRGHFSYVIGALHQISELWRETRDPARIQDDFLATLQRFLQHDFQILAHPFRLFHRAGIEISDDLMLTTIRLIKEAGVAAEINFHTNEPTPEFVRLCIEAGIPLTFGGDAHNLYEIGDFALHLDLLRRAGYDGDLADILLPWPDGGK